MFRVSKRLLRHYNEIGLLVPAEVDESNGYSYYGREQCDTMELILYLRTLHIPLPDIKLFLNKPLETWGGGIDQHLDAIRDQKQRLQHVESELLLVQERLSKGEPILK
jgi:DNA-binding transcriptional MerR regulator